MIPPPPPPSVRRCEVCAEEIRLNAEWVHTKGELGHQAVRAPFQVVRDIVGARLTRPEFPSNHEDDEYLSERVRWGMALHNRIDWAFGLAIAALVVAFVALIIAANAGK